MKNSRQLSANTFLMEFRLSELQFPPFAVFTVATRCVCVCTGKRKREEDEIRSGL